MVDFAQKLMTAAEVWGSDTAPLTPNPMATATGSSQKAIFRIGFWPVTSDSEAEIGTGMGIGLILAALLEQWPSVCVYRLMTQLRDTSSNYQWGIEDTQFGVDDWEVEGLDENVAIWGSLTAQNDHLILSLEVENDAREDDDTLVLNHESDTLVDILNQLPVIAATIIKWLDGTNTGSDSQNTYDTVTIGDEISVRDFLEDVFLWEVDYFLELWGQGSSNDQVLESQSNLIDLSNNLTSNLGAWLLSQSISRFVIFDETNWSRWLLPTVKETASALGKYSISAKIFGTLLVRCKENLEAFDVLETGISLHPNDKEIWMTLGDIYMQQGENLSAIDVFQRAIEAGVATAELYWRYASLMDTLVEHQIKLNEGATRISAAGRPYVEQYIFMDARADAPSLRESCAAYRQVVGLDNTNINVIAGLVIRLLSLDEPDAWDFCAQLIDKDKEGITTAAVIEQIDNSDMDHLRRLLQTASAKDPKALGPHLSLVRVYLALGEDDNAKRELHTISGSQIPLQIQPTLVRLRLLTDEPDFDIRIGEIQDVLDANGQVSSEDVDFLESVVEKEPLFTEGYKLLARSYLSWDEADHALEVLLDGQKTVPFDSELLALLAKVLWDEDQADLAYAYLDQGLNTNDSDAALLSLMGRFLFEDGEDDTAKEYLRRAEAADPLSAELSITRSYIANTLLKSKKP
jgi:tetratricopeptide (TPR) repeat protein